MKFIQEFKIFESTQELPEFGTKWINDKGEKIFILRPDQYGNIGYYRMNDPEHRWNMKPATFYSEYKPLEDRKSTRLNSSHITISYAVFCLKKKKKQ